MDRNKKLNIYWNKTNAWHAIIFICFRLLLNNMGSMHCFGGHTFCILFNLLQHRMYIMKVQNTEIPRNQTQ